MIVHFVLPILFVLTLTSDRAVLYGNVAFSLLVLSTKKRYSNFFQSKSIQNVQNFQWLLHENMPISQTEGYFTSDCYMKTCRSLKQRAILPVIVTWKHAHFSNRGLFYQWLLHENMPISHTEGYFTSDSYMKTCPSLKQRAILPVILTWKHADLSNGGLFYQWLLHENMPISQTEGYFTSDCYMKTCRSLKRRAIF